MVAYYGNYSIIFDKLLFLSGNIFNSISASIGNLIAENNKEKIFQTYWELFSIRFIFTSIIAFSLYVSMPYFISFWLGPKYILTHTVFLLMVISLFFDQIRSITDQFLFGYGLFYDVWASILEAVVSISVSIVCGYCWGLEGVICGNISSNVFIAQIWKPIFLFRKGFNMKPKYYYTNLIIYVVLLCISLYISLYLINNSLISFVFYVLICVAVFGFILISFLLLFTSGTRNIFRRIFNLKIFVR